MPESSSRWFAIINPVAGDGRGLQDWPLISRLLREQGIIPEYAFTEKKYHAIELAVEAVNRGHRNIIVVGGDGTLHEAINGLFIQDKVPARDILMAVIAVGASPDWIRMPGIPQKYTDAVRAIAEGNSCLQDVAKISYHKSHFRQTRYMANVAGIGFDAFVNHKFNVLKEKGRWNRRSHMWNALLAVLGYFSTSVKVWVDDELSVDEHVYSATIGIDQSCVDKRELAALTNSGAFNVAVIRRLGRLGVLRRFNSLRRGKMNKVEGVGIDRGRKIRIDSVPAVRVEIDGEALGFSPLEFEIISNALKVVVLQKLLKSDSALS